ncbi:protein kinase domain-containing protein [Legionella rowbothamii]|uniref:protein kinase domain-containing protein n=1 Tax=Legionella rowbothamii TaxID=96229 RepID=UPI001054FD99|nr:protein kinase [Legionella rowbothamii]
MPQIINPKNLSPQNAEKLYAFFEGQLQKGVHVWSNGSVYSFADGSDFIFSSQVIMRQPKEGKTGVRYEFISDRQLGKGSYGIVYEIEGTFKIDKTSFRFKEHGQNGKSRAVKIQHHNYHHPEYTAWEEYNFSKRASHLAIKQPVFSGQVSYTVMRELKGKDLDQILQDDLLGKNVLTLENRSELTKALLKALKEQVTDKSIIHRDIKPENILVDMSTFPITVNIIDFGLSTNADKPDGEYPGTPLYQAPELWDRVSQSSKADVFSMGRIIAELWRDTTVSTLMTINSFTYACDNAHNVSLDTLFTGIDELDNENKSIIKETLKGMLCANSNQRLSIDQAIEYFSHVNLSSPRAEQNADGNRENLPHANLSPTTEQNPDKNREHPPYVNLVATTEPKIENMAILTRYHPQSMLRIEAILAQIKLLRAQAGDLIYRGSDDVAGKLSLLATDLETKMNQLKYMSLTNYNQCVEQYAADCQTLINTSKEDFANHRNINYILANVALAIAGLGVVYLAAGIVNLVVTKGNNFLFFKETKTSSLVRAVEENLTGIKC